MSFCFFQPIFKKKSSRDFKNVKKTWEYIGTPSYSFVSVAVNNFYNVFASGNGNVIKLSPNGEYLWKYYLGNNALGLATDSFDNLYVSTANGSLTKLNQNGTLVWSYTVGSTINGISLDSIGYVYAAASSLNKITSTGNFNNSYSNGYPFYDVAVDYLDNICTINTGSNVVKKLNNSLTLQWQCTVISGCIRIAVDKLNNVYVANGNYVSKISSDGSVIWQFNNSAKVNSVAADDNSNVYLVDNSSYLKKLASDMSIVWTLTLNGAVYDVTVDNDYNIYTADASGRVTKFQQY